MATQTTVTFTTDFTASTRLSSPNTRISPARGLMRDRSNRKARRLNRNRVCTNTDTEPVSRAASVIGAAALRRASAARRNGGMRVGSSSCDRARNTVSRRARPVLRAGAAMKTTSVTARSPRKDVSSRETGACPSSRARCSRRGVAASVLSSCCESPAIAAQSPGRAANPDRTAVSQADSSVPDNIASSRMPPMIWPGIATK